MKARSAGQCPALNGPKSQHRVTFALTRLPSQAEGLVTFQESLDVARRRWGGKRHHAQATSAPKTV